MSANFDAASGLPMTPAARKALSAALDHGWADPARLHRDGRLARQLLDASRAAVAAVVGALPQEVTFATSGTHALQLAVLGTARGRRRSGATIVASAVEHSAVLRAADFAAAWSASDAASAEPILVGVNGDAQVSIKAFRRALRAGGVALAAVQHVNHEVGTVQPLAEVHAATKDAQVPLLVDACASLGHLPCPRDWDLLVGSAHKWGGPAGVGILIVRSGVRWRSPWPTDDAGAPAGFVNVPAIVAAATALEQAADDVARTCAARQGLTERLRREVPRCAQDILVLGPDDPRAPHIVCFTVVEADGERLVQELDRRGFAVNSGSACTADTRRPSHVLAAMGVMTHGNLRVSLAPDATDGDVSAFLSVLPEAIAASREAALLKAQT